MYKKQTSIWQKIPTPFLWIGGILLAIITYITGIRIFNKIKNSVAAAKTEGKVDKVIIEDKTLGYDQSKCKAIAENFLKEKNKNFLFRSAFTMFDELQKINTKPEAVFVNSYYKIISQSSLLADAKEFLGLFGYKNFDSLKDIIKNNLD